MGDIYRAVGKWKYVLNRMECLNMAELVPLFLETGTSDEETGNIGALVVESLRGWVLFPRLGV